MPTSNGITCPSCNEFKDPAHVCAPMWDVIIEQGSAMRARGWSEDAAINSAVRTQIEMRELLAKGESRETMHAKVRQVGNMVWQSFEVTPSISVELLIIRKEHE